LNANTYGGDLPGQRSFRDAYDGWLSGVLTWPDYDSLLDVVKSRPTGWYIYDTLRAPPLTPEPNATLPDSLTEITAFLRDRRRANYCGFVYVDDRAVPSLIKIYDPCTASACGTSAASIPTFTISRMPPEALPFAADVPERRGLLSRIIKGSP